MSKSYPPMHWDEPRVELPPQPAGFWIRVAATLLDGVILIPITLGVLYAFLTKNQPLLLGLSIPGMLYKPFMESYCGATLGKMICGLRVVNGGGERISLVTAYLRFAPLLVSNILGLLIYIWLFDQPAFAEAADFREMSAVMASSPYYTANMVMGWLLLFDCVVVAFTDRKRALHDMLAGTYCEWKPAGA